MLRRRRIDDGRRQKEKGMKEERIIVSYFKFGSFRSLHQTELNTFVIKRDMNFFMGDFLKPVSHAPTLWDNSDY
jgi:hypothetical protein